MCCTAEKNGRILSRPQVGRIGQISRRKGWHTCPITDSSECASDMERMIGSILVYTKWINEDGWDLHILDASNSSETKVFKQSEHGHKPLRLGRNTNGRHCIDSLSRSRYRSSTSVLPRWKRSSHRTLLLSLKTSPWLRINPLATSLVFSCGGRKSVTIQRKLRGAK